MNKLLYTFLFLVLWICKSISQIGLPSWLPNPSSNGYAKWGYLRQDSGLIMMPRDTFCAKYPTVILHNNGKYYRTDGNCGIWQEFNYLYTASNGLTLVGNDFRLGGTLNNNTNINLNNNSLTVLNGSQDKNEFLPNYTAVTHYNLGVYANFFRITRDSGRIDNYYTDSINSPTKYTRGALHITGGVGTVGFNIPTVNSSPYQDSTTFYKAKIDTSFIQGKNVIFNGFISGNNTLKMHIDTIGRLGIRRSPFQALHVNGQVQIDTLNNALTTDSIVAVNAGILRKRVSSDFLYTASNGLNKVGNDFRLGGTLNNNTQILLGGNELNIQQGMQDRNEFLPNFTAITHYDLGLYATQLGIARSSGGINVYYTDSANLLVKYTRGSVVAAPSSAIIGFNLPVASMMLPLPDYQDSTAFYQSKKDTSVIQGKNVLFNGFIGGTNITKMQLDTIGRLGIRRSPFQALHVNGQVQIDTLNTGISTDSLIVVNAGILKKIKSSVITGGIDAFNEVFISSGTTTVTLAHAYVSGTIRLYRLGARIDPSQITESTATTITLGFTPSVGDRLIIDYKY